MNNTAIFTISSKNYFSFSKTFLESVRKYHPEVDLHFLLADEAEDLSIFINKEIYELSSVKDIGIPEIEKMAFIYDIVEFNTAVKPFFIEYLFKKGYQKVIYLDPDILVVNRLDAAIEKLDIHSIVVTPHQLTPVKNIECSVPFLEWEQGAIQSGIFNLGFIGIANTPEGRSFIAWWSNRCKYLCFIEPQTGLVVDQKWVNIASCFFSTFHILRHEGYNVAIWNLHERTVMNNYVNGEKPLVFFHFSSFDFDAPDIISKHDRQMKLSDRPGLVELFKTYRQKLKNNGFDHFRSLPYAYDYFHDGDKIELIERRLYTFISAFYHNPFQIPSKEFRRTLKKIRRLHTCGPSVRKRSYVSRCAEKMLTTLYVLIGAKQYTKIVKSLSGIDCMRKHSWLIE